MKQHYTEKPLTRLLGDKGEDAVYAWLIKNKFTVVARNYQTRQGEVDLIAQKGDVIAFIEVKTRNTEYFPLAQTVTYTKQQRIIKASRHYIFTHQLQDKVFRFDVATVLIKNQEYSIEYIPNAFGPR